MPIPTSQKTGQAWVVAVNMGYGHQRTAFPLRNLAPGGKIINANDYPGIPKRDRNIWEGTRKIYEFISNFKRIFLVGELAFLIFNQFQKIITFYPKKDLSKPNFQLKQMFSLIKNGWGKQLIEKLKENPLPLIATFFPQTFMAEFFNYPGDIFCVVCDADIARSWAALKPARSRIKYFVPTSRVVERLKLYGVKKENIFLTGYPLPMENIGDEKMEILKEDLRYRLFNLDPNKKYLERYKILVKKALGDLPGNPNHPLTLLFSIGGVGAQKEIAVKILKSLAGRIKKGQIRVILSAGTKEKAKDYFIDKAAKIGLAGHFGSGIEIIFDPNTEDYFRKFNLALRESDILWTKPSELSFYSALGLPFIIAPPIGSQEEFNMRWLLKSGFGLLQEDPDYTEEWLFDWLKRGYLAEAAMEGFVEGEKLGTINIKRMISK